MVWLALAIVGLGHQLVYVFGFGYQTQISAGALTRQSSLIHQRHSADTSRMPHRYVGQTTSAAACARLVAKNNADANGATWGSENHKCYAEFGATGIRLLPRHPAIAQSSGT